jgi:tetratricopeptide (TPR) repeat protein
MWFRNALIGFVILLPPDRVDAQGMSCSSIPPLAEVGSTKNEKLDGLSRMAFACVQAGKPELAVDFYSEIINLDPTNERAYLNRANAYLQNRQFQLGIADVSHVISGKPTFAEAWYNRGN